MGWRRGFFRWWVLFTVLWLIPVVGFTLASKPDHPPVVLVYLQDREKPVGFSRSADADALARLRGQRRLDEVALSGLPEATVLVDASWDPDRRRKAVDEAREVQAEAHDDAVSEHRQAQAEAILGYGLGIPLALLLLAEAVAWTLGSFRRKPV